MHYNEETSSVDVDADVVLLFDLIRICMSNNISTRFKNILLHFLNGYSEPNSNMFYDLENAFPAFCET